jgi:hypothetical protein
MSEHFWYILFGAVFVTINIILWVYRQHCNAKGVTAPAPFETFKKHERRISQWSDFFIIAAISAGATFYGFMLYSFNANTLPDMQPGQLQANTQSLVPLNLLLLFIFSVTAATLAGFLSPFQNNLTAAKRFILGALCGIPVLFGVTYCILDNTQSLSFHLKLVSGSLLPVLLIHGSAVIWGKPFAEFFPHLCSKIPLPWFQIPEAKDIDQ